MTSRGIIVLWLCFLLGAIVNLLRQGKATTTRTGTRFDDWVRLNYDIIIFRTVLGGAIFALWVTGKGAVLSAAAKYVDITLPVVPVTGATALMFGLFTDYMLHWATDHSSLLHRIIPSWPEETTPAKPPTG